jgi:hypothetical protein
MQAPLRDEEDIKIFILFLLRNLNYPMNFASINDIVLQDEVVGYFDFAECFAKLVEGGNIAEIKNENAEATYQITEQGIHVADTLYSRILRSIRDRGLRSAYRLITFRDRGAKTLNEITENPDGSYNFHCEIKEREKVMLNINIAVGTKRQVEQIEYNFKEYTENIYAEVLRVLSGESN